MEKYGNFNRNIEDRVERPPSVHVQVCKRQSQELVVLGRKRRTYMNWMLPKLKPWEDKLEIIHIYIPVLKNRSAYLLLDHSV